MGIPEAPTEPSPDQQTALVTADRVERGGSGVWPSVDPKDLAASMRLRILNPASINQAMTPSCALAAIAYALALDNPRLYAEVIAALYQNGRPSRPGPGSTGKVLVASHGLRNVDYTEIYKVRGPSNQPAADWILLSSIRNSESWANIYWGSDKWIGGMGGITLPSTFEKWLTGFGYTIVINYTNLVRTMGLGDLEDANSLFRNHWRVFLFINSKVLTQGTQTDWSAVPNHYVSLAARISIEDKTGGQNPEVSFRCSSWGRLCNVPEKHNDHLSGKDFCKNFYGYLAARY